MAWVHKVPAPALWLGLGGLLPFVGLALRAKLGSPEVHTTSLVALLQYGALIITFVGALHWGYAVAGVAAGTGQPALRLERAAVAAGLVVAAAAPECGPVAAGGAAGALLADGPLAAAAR